MYKKTNSYMALFGFILFSILSPNTHANTSCEPVNIGTSKVLGSKQSHCVTLPIYTNKPLVIIQYEVSNLSLKPGLEFGSLNATKGDQG